MTKKLIIKSRTFYEELLFAVIVNVKMFVVGILQKKTAEVGKHFLNNAYKKINNLNEPQTIYKELKTFGLSVVLINAANNHKTALLLY